jgi:hypothetical protein
LYTKEEYDLYISYQKSLNMNFSLQQRAKRFVEQHEKPLRRAHLIERAAVNKGYTYVFLSPHAKPPDETHYQLSWRAPDIAKALYSQYTFGNPHQRLKSESEGLLWYTPKDKPYWFRPVKPSIRRITYHRIKNQLYQYNKFGEPIVSDSFHKSPKSLRNRKYAIDKAQALAVSSTTAVTALVAVPASVTVPLSHGINNNWPVTPTAALASASGVTTIALGLAAIFSTVSFTPKLFVSARHAVERTGMNVLKAIAGKQP